MPEGKLVVGIGDGVGVGAGVGLVAGVEVDVSTTVKLTDATPVVQAESRHTLRVYVPALRFEVEKPKEAVSIFVPEL